MDRDTLRLAATLVAVQCLKLAGDYHPYGNPNATGEPHDASALGRSISTVQRLASEHAGNLGANHSAVIQQHIQRAASASAAGDHTTAEMHLRDASRRVHSQLGSGHILAYAMRGAIAQHEAAAHAQMGLRGTPGAGAGSGLGHDVQRALGQHDSGERLPSGPAHRALGAHIEHHAPFFGRRPSA